MFSLLLKIEESAGLGGLTPNTPRSEDTGVLTPDADVPQVFASGSYPLCARQTWRLRQGLNPRPLA